MNQINQREVFYIAGYDPRSFRYYYSLYKENSKKYNKLNQLDINLSKVKKEREFLHSFNISTNIATVTNYTFLSWNDIVKNNWTSGFIKNVLDSLYFIKMFIFSGIYAKVAKESTKQIIAGSYPLFYLIVTILLTFFISYNLYIYTSIYFLNLISFIFSLLIFIIGTKIIQIIGEKIAVFWLSRIYAFCGKYSQKKVKNIEDRIEYFAEYIFNKIKDLDNANKEFILSSHSVGTILAVSISIRVINKCKTNNINYSNFKLLTLGHCLPLVSYQKNFLEFRTDLENLSKIRNFTWLDFTSIIDGACFPLIDPISSSGIKKEIETVPYLLSTRFHKLYEKDKYEEIKKNKYEAHFLYLYSSEILGNYDYFDITAGNKPLEYRIENYMKEN